jgi:hypothetical protein
VLLTAVALKTEGLAEGSHHASVFPWWVQLTVTEVELVVGLWLIAGWTRIAANAAAIGTFAVLGLASAYLIIHGSAACGCFGRVRVHPKWTLLLDVFCCAALFVARPRQRVPPESASERS